MILQLANGAILPVFWAIFWTSADTLVRHRWAWWRRHISMSGVLTEIIWFCSVDLGIWAIQRHWWSMASTTLVLIITIAIRRWRKNRKKIMQALGAKARALREALVRKQQEVMKPRQVLVPQRTWG